MKRLLRSNENKILFGVCSGMGKYFDIDPVIIRIIFIILLFTGGSGFLAYIIAIFIIPEEKPFRPNKTNSNDFDNNFNSTDNTYDEKKESFGTINDDSNSYNELSDKYYNKKSNNSSEITGLIIGISLIFFGALFLMRNFSFWNDIYIFIMPLIKKFFWPSVLIILGVFVIYKNK